MLTFEWYSSLQVWSSCVPALAQAEDLINVGTHTFHNLEQKPPTKWGDRISIDWCSKHSCLQLLVKQKLAQGSSIATFSSSLLRLCPEELSVFYFKKRRKLGTCLETGRWEKTFTLVVSGLEKFYTYCVLMVLEPIKSKFPTAWVSISTP
jgi:hypothetical protein